MNLLESLIGKSEEKQPAESSAEKSADFFFCFSAKKHFQVEEEEIYARLRSAITLRPSFDQVIRDKPDLYGPFWVATTLIIVIVASSSLIVFFDNKKQAFNFDSISIAAGLIYGITFGCPYVVAFMAKIFGGVVSVVYIICIYGYSFTAFLPVTAFCFLDSSLLQIALLAIGFCLSTVFLIRGVLKLVQGLGDKERLVIGVFIVGTQLLLVFMYKFYFFALM